MRNNQKGFTLIEMLVVIAIIAILVSIIIPTVSTATDKARAAADAANLRTVLGLLNAEVVNGEKTVPEIIDASLHPTSKFCPDAVLCAIYDRPGFIDVFYVDGDAYYSLTYLRELATFGPNSPKLEEIGTSKPDIEGTWYQAGFGEMETENDPTEGE